MRRVAHGNRWRLAAAATPSVVLLLHWFMRTGLLPCWLLRKAAAPPAAARMASADGSAARTPAPVRPLSPQEARGAAAMTVAYYAAVASKYASGDIDNDVGHNIESLLAPLADRPAPLDILDVGCASGRDLKTFTSLGHRAIGLDAVAEFCEMSRERSGCEVWQQDLTAPDLPEERFDGIFCSACLPHVPSAALPRTLEALTRALRPGGVLFASNAHGFGEDKEGYTGERTDYQRCWSCRLSEESWLEHCEAVGLELLGKYYLPLGLPRPKQPFLATVWRRPV